MQESTYRGFTDEEWIVIDNALEALLTELEEAADPVLEEAIENVSFAYDLDEPMIQELKDQYCDHCNLEYSDFL